MKQASDPRKASPIRLDYGHSRYPRKAERLHIAFQLSLGASLWFAGVALFFAVVALLQYTNIAIGLVGPISFACVLGIAFWLRAKFDWRGIIPGMLIGIGLTCRVSDAFCGPKTSQWASRPWCGIPHGRLVRRATQHERSVLHLPRKKNAPLVLVRSGVPDRHRGVPRFMGETPMRLFKPPDVSRTLTCLTPIGLVAIFKLLR